MTDIVDDGDDISIDRGAVAVVLSTPFLSNEKSNDKTLVVHNFHEIRKAIVSCLDIPDNAQGANDSIHTPYPRSLIRTGSSDRLTVVILASASPAVPRLQLARLTSRHVP